MSGGKNRFLLRREPFKARGSNGKTNAQWEYLAGRKGKKQAEKRAFYS